MRSQVGTHLVRAIIVVTFLGIFYISSFTSPQSLSKRSLPDDDLSHVLNKSEWHFLERRAAGTWKEAVDSGEKYLANLRGNCGDSKATLPELQEEWSESTFNGETATAKSLPEVFKALGLSTEIGKAVKASYWSQDLEYGEDKDKEPTGGFYSNIMSPSQGFISCENNYGPAHAIKDKEMDPRVVGLPTVSQLSDVLFLDWQRFAGKSTKVKKNLKYFFRYHIENAQTRAIIEQATDHNILPYPGTNFPIESEQGKALLGTPNGVGVAFFLSTHKAYFGNKIPKSIKVFQSTEETGKWYNMIFFIDVEPTDGSSGV